MIREIPQEICLISHFVRLSSCVLVLRWMAPCLDPLGDPAGRADDREDVVRERFSNLESEVLYVRSSRSRNSFGSCQSAIWRNESENGTRHSVAISRIYKTENGWESSTSFGRDELPLVAKVADLAHSWIYQQSPVADREKEEGNPNPSPPARAPAHVRLQVSLRARTFRERLFLKDSRTTYLSTFLHRWCG